MSSNRTIRRAAERAALKAARKADRQAIANAAVTAPANKAFNATASLLSGDNQAIINNNILTDNSELMNNVPPNTPQSTGPRTPAGKEISARNAMKHGLCAVKTLILPNESMSDYMALEANWFQTYRTHPFDDSRDPIKCELIRTAARAEWFFKRAERNYSDVEARLFSETPEMADWTDEQHKKLSRALRYRTANANILGKHRKELEAHIKARAAESANQQKSQERDERMNMAKERLAIFREKNKPFDLAEELEAMKQKAIRLGFRQPDADPAAE